jgi:hypothetical protein
MGLARMPVLSGSTRAYDDYGKKQHGFHGGSYTRVMVRAMDRANAIDTTRGITTTKLLRWQEKPTPKNGNSRYKRPCRPSAIESATP